MGTLRITILKLYKNCDCHQSFARPASPSPGRKRQPIRGPKHRQEPKNQRNDTTDHPDNDNTTTTTTETHKPKPTTDTNQTPHRQKTNKRNSPHNPLQKTTGRTSTRQQSQLLIKKQTPDYKRPPPETTTTQQQNQAKPNQSTNKTKRAPGKPSRPNKAGQPTTKKQNNNNPEFCLKDITAQNYNAKQSNNKRM